jgi:tripartite-type tricarboxylate transporter receptor subunit TctC
MGRMQRLISALAFGLVAILILGTGPASAQVWPQRTVKLLLPLGPGAGVDIGARLFADRLTARWGQPVVVENKPGGDALVAINAFLGSHDDHVLLDSPTSAFTAHPYLHDKLPYKPSDLLPIVGISNTVVTIAVPVTLKVGSLAELLALARSQPGKLNWAGITGAFDFIFEGFLKSTGVEITKVPYRNPVEALNDLAEGRVQVYEAALAIVQPQLQAGKIKLLAVTNGVRAPTEPDVPTVTETGFPALALDGLVGLFGTSEMPKAVRDRIYSDIRAVAAADPIIASRLTATGQILNIADAAQFAKAIEEQRAKIAASAKTLGVKPAE